MSCSSESDSASSEEWHQQLPSSLADAPNDPLLPYFIGYLGHSIQQKVNPRQVVSKLAQQIGQEMQKPSELAKVGTMDRFGIMVDVIRTMSQKQLEEATTELYSKPAQDKDGVPTQQYSAWMAYRDAVAQAGTGPTLLTINNWIRNKQVQGEEAAQVVAAQVNAAKVPSPQYMKAFFVSSLILLTSL